MKLRIYESPSESSYNEYPLPMSVITDSFLDEELDSAPITLFDIEKTEPFSPFTLVSLFDTVKEEETFYFIASDDVERNIGTGRATHTLTLIEPTKWLERFMIGNKTVTQPLRG